MPADVPDLLLLRLDALELDIEKVRLAVTRAQQRGQFLFQASQSITPCNAKLRQLQRHLDGLIKAMEDEPELESLLADQLIDVDLRAAPDVVTEVIELVRATTTSLRLVMDTAVSLDDRSMALQNSLNLRCNELCDQIGKLRAEVVASPPAGRRDQWREYQRLLDNVARPVFEEYVDFLGGLTVRDTGLDDRVCDMTDALLTRFKSVTQRSLPLPARAGGAQLPCRGCATGHPSGSGRDRHRSAAGGPVDRRLPSHDGSGRRRQPACRHRAGHCVAASRRVARGGAVRPARSGTSAPKLDRRELLRPVAAAGRQSGRGGQDRHGSARALAR